MSGQLPLPENFHTVKLDNIEKADNMENCNFGKIAHVLFKFMYNVKILKYLVTFLQNYILVEFPHYSSVKSKKWTIKSLTQTPIHSANPMKNVRNNRIIRRKYSRFPRPTPPSKCKCLAQNEIHRATRYIMRNPYNSRESRFIRKRHLASLIPDSAWARTHTCTYIISIFLSWLIYSLLARIYTRSRCMHITSVDRVRGIELGRRAWTARARNSSARESHPVYRIMREPRRRVAIIPGAGGGLSPTLGLFGWNQ